MYKYILLITLLIASSLKNVYAQGLVDDLSTPINKAGLYDELFTEYIKVIGNSRRIFIMTNNNQKLGTGDFFSIVLNEKLTARALVAKKNGDLIGVKIMRVDSLANWARIRKGIAVQVLKGDDTAFKEKQKNPKKADDAVAAKINSEEDLFKESAIMIDDIDLEDKSNRALKTDNIVSAQMGMLAVDERGNEQMWNMQWAYQIADNIFIEGLYGYMLLTEYPGELIETSIANFTARLKYAFKAPLYSFVIPYVGFQTLSVSSPEAGTSIPGKTSTSSELQREIDIVNGMRKKQFVVGLTVLRRLVPGWFVKADLGTDIMSVGFAIEF